jgi:hypothetical protein
VQPRLRDRSLLASLAPKSTTENQLEITTGTHNHGEDEQHEGEQEGRPIGVFTLERARTRAPGILLRVWRRKTQLELNQHSTHRINGISSKNTAKITTEKQPKLN